MMILRFLAETLCAISAAYLRLDIIKTSSSFNERGGRIDGTAQTYCQPLYLDIVNDKLPEAIRQSVPSLPVSSIPNVGHEILTFEPPPNSVINALWLSPVGLRETPMTPPLQTKTH